MSKKKPKYQLKRFYGIVHSKEWVASHNGHSYVNFCGYISILRDQEIAGFEAHGNEANWIARVETHDGRKSFNILGCQIRAISQLDADADKPKLEINTMDIENL